MSSSDPTRSHREVLRWGPPLLITMISLAIALRWWVMGIGPIMWAGYPAGLFVQLLFGMLAVSAAFGVLSAPKPRGGFLLLFVRLLAVFAAHDAMRTFASDWFFSGAVILALVHLFLTPVLFRLGPARGVFIASITFLVKTIGTEMTEKTLYTLF